jgi:excisionase family DNA binding protein
VPKPIKNDQLLTDRQVAERWSTSRTTVRRLRYRGALPTTRVGSLARIPLSAVLAYEAAQTEGGAA